MSMPARRFCSVLVAAPMLLVLAAHHSPAQTPNPPAQISAADPQVRASRESFVHSVKDGTLVAFDEALGTVTFKPLKPTDTDHEPGPMEDEVIASAVRAAVAGNEGLRGLKVDVVCQAGALRMQPGASATAAQTAELIQLALASESVRQVSTGLPASLKLLPAS